MSVQATFLLLLALSSSVFLPEAIKADNQPDKAPKAHTLVFDQNYNVQKEQRQIVESFSNPKNINILWWNVYKKGLDSQALNQNLLTMMNEPNAVDIIVLGEFDALKTLNDEAKATLMLHYPYIEYFHYSKANDKPTDRSILVASRIRPKKRTYIKNGLAWTDPKSKNNEKADYQASWKQTDIDKVQAKQWTRSFISLTFDISGEDLTLIPVHLANPWAAIKHHYDYDPVGLSKYVCTGCSVVFGEDNPLANQIETLNEKAKKKFHGKNNQKVLLFGDFNMPKAVAYTNTRSYEFLISEMRETKQEHKSTFPTLLANERGNDTPNIEIDHCFSLPKKDKDITSHMISLKGSDHYPLLIDVEYP